MKIEFVKIDDETLQVDCEPRTGYVGRLTLPAELVTHILTLQAVGSVDERDAQIAELRNSCRQYSTRVRDLEDQLKAARKCVSAWNEYRKERTSTPTCGVVAGVEKANQRSAELIRDIDELTVYDASSALKRILRQLADK